MLAPTCCTTAPHINRKHFPSPFSPSLSKQDLLAPLSLFFFSFFYDVSQVSVVIIISLF
jgi:hypothetical protein